MRGVFSGLLVREAVEAHTGFEPVFGENPGEEAARPEPDALSASDQPAELQRVVEQVSRSGRAGAREV